MADFRKLFLVLAVLAVATAPAFGQTTPPFSCVANTVTNSQMRGGGITELAGDIVLQCSGGTGSGLIDATAVPTSFAAQIQGGATAVTNKIGDLAPGSGFPISAKLVLSDVNNHFVTSYPGFLQPGAPTVVVFPNVTLPTGTTEFVRITGLRVAAQPVANASATVPVYETVSSTPLNYVSASSPLLQVGTVYPALQMAVTNCAGGTFSAAGFTQCIDNPVAAHPGDLSFGVKFSESIVASAFRTKAQENGPLVNGAPTDLADQGTRLLLTFTNVPAGVTIFVTDREIANSPTSTTASTTGSMASLVTGADVNGAGGSTGATSTTAATCSGNSITNNDLTTAVHLVKASTSGGVVYAVWEVTADNPINFDALLFGVQVAFTADPAASSPGLTTSTALPGAVGSFAPVSTIVAADATAEIPRFQSTNLTNNDLFTISPCVTNLLFPYVTNQQGYETGIALVNTSTDNATGPTGSPANAPFNTSSQTGTCTMYFFGTDAPSAPFVTPAIGSTSTDNPFLYTNTVGAIAPNFSGYVITRCNFQYAHGLAFILTPGGNGSEYLALVIPDRAGSRPPDPFVTGGSGTGEQLGY